LRGRRGRLTWPSPHQDPLSEPPLSPPPPESQEPLSEPPKSQEPLSEPPESHEPLSEPESHHDPLSEPLELSELPLSQPESPDHEDPPPPSQPPEETLDPDWEQMNERMHNTMPIAKKGAALFSRFIDCLLIVRG
jgi:hypothetical protein